MYVNFGFKSHLALYSPHSTHTHTHHTDKSRETLEFERSLNDDDDDEDKVIRKNSSDHYRGVCVFIYISSSPIKRVFCSTTLKRNTIYIFTRREQKLFNSLCYGPFDRHSKHRTDERIPKNSIDVNRDFQVRLDVLTVNHSNI